MNAYKVFETLNARGVRLSSTDLLKNYLFSVLHRENEHLHEMKVLEDRWEAMVTRLGSESFTDFLRIHWISRRTFVRQSELFKTIRTKVTNREAVFQLLRDMEEDMDTYLALTNPEASQWHPDLKGYAQNLRMFSVRQPFPLIFAAHRKLSDTDFASLLRSCVIISFRYNVIGSQPTNEQERIYYAVAQKIANSDITTANAALEGMKAVYPNDDPLKPPLPKKLFAPLTPEICVLSAIFSVHWKSKPADMITTLRVIVSMLSMSYRKTLKKIGKPLPMKKQTRWFIDWAT